MKRNALFAAIALGGASLFSSQLFSQGSLTPPGGPAPIMKSLDQIASTGKAINATNSPGDSGNTFIISSPGSYYLANDLNGAAGKNGIQINSDNVSIDLNGFAVVCAGSGTNTVSGIVDTGGHRNLSVSNGTVRGWGSANILLISSNVELHRLRLSDGAGNGAGGGFSGDGFNGRQCLNARIVDCIATSNMGDGFATSNNSVVTGCVATGNALSGFSGVSAAFSNCTANMNVGFGYFIFGGCALTNCTAGSNQGTGFLSDGTTIMTGCQASNNTGPGFFFFTNCTGTNCVSSGNGGDGFNFASNNVLSNNLASANTGDGFHGTGQNNRIDGNNAIGNTGAGIHPSSGSADFVIRNTAFANSPNYNPASGTYIGPTTATPSTATSPWANF